MAGTISNRHWIWGLGVSGIPPAPTASILMLVVNHKIVLYYTGFPYGHQSEGYRDATAANGGPGRTYYRGAIGRATLRLDGFASLHAGETEAAILEQEAGFSKGSRLVVNARGRPRG